LSREADLPADGIELLARLVRRQNRKLRGRQMKLRMVSLIHLVISLLLNLVDGG
jgi:hypothetical protein